MHSDGATMSMPAIIGLCISDITLRGSRHMTVIPSMTRRAVFVAMLILSAFPRSLRSQIAEHYGLTGQLAATYARLSLEDESRARQHGAVTAAVGFRIRVPLRKSLPAVSLTPLFTIGVTSLRGVREGTRQAAFSHVDRGLQLAMRTGRVRPYVTLRSGTRTLERSNGGEAANYFGSGTAFVAGIEIPCTRAGRGLDLSVSRLLGRFDMREDRDVRTPASLGYRATTVSAGWSGRFRGTRLLFDCRE